MKKFFLSAIVAIALLSGCTCHTYTSPATAYDYSDQQYSYIQSPTGQQMVVVRDNSGAQILMEYMLFNSLMNSGGYGSVINYYHVHPTMFRAYDTRTYSTWHSVQGKSYNVPRSSGFRSSGTSSSSGSYFKNTPQTPKSSGFRSSTSTYSKPASTGFRSSSSSSSGGSFRSSGSNFRSSSFRSGRH